MERHILVHCFNFLGIGTIETSTGVGAVVFYY
jgi:hypothetical protein